jgi:hypothetical protein
MALSMAAKVKIYKPYICPKKEFSVENDNAIKAVIITIIISMYSRKDIKLFLLDIIPITPIINMKFCIMYANIILYLKSL